MVSEDSGAYLPMVVETLRSTAASRGLAAAAIGSAADSAPDAHEEARPALGGGVRSGSQVEGVSEHGEDSDADLERQGSLQPSAQDRSNSLDCSCSAHDVSPAHKCINDSSGHCGRRKHETQAAAVLAGAATSSGRLGSV